MSLQDSLNAISVPEALDIPHGMLMSSLGERGIESPARGQAEKIPVANNILYTGLPWPESRLEGIPPIDHFFYTEE